MPTAITIATMNLLNLAKPGQVTHKKSTPLDQETYVQKVKWIASKLTEMKADIIGFQEVWSAEALADCFKEAKLDSKYTIVARDGPPGLVQVAAAIAKKYDVMTPMASAWIENFPPEFVLKKRPPGPGEQLNTMEVLMKQFSRPVLGLDVRIETGLTLRFYVIHMKSKLKMNLDSEEFAVAAIRPHATALGEALSTIRRTAEVAALRVMLNKELKETQLPIVVVGDLNDGHLSTTAAILSSQPPHKLFAASRVGNEPTQAGDIGLYSAQTLQQYRSLRDVYYTYDHENVMESLDHVFVSEEFYEHSPKSIWTFRELRVMNDHVHFRKSNDKVVSDHGIVVAKFDAKKQPDA
jgi:endonuclease/exonuclease/phosphatase family metal-dependent hydrolase